MAEKVAKIGINKEKGFLYFLDKEGDVSCVPMSRGTSKSKQKTKKVAKVGVKREKGFLYFLDKQGDVARAKMMRGRK